MSNLNAVKSVFRWGVAEDGDEQPPRMDPEFKKEWVAALRSGKYQQARNALKVWRDSINDWGYCCLGVAGDLKCDNLPEGDTKVAWHHNTILMVWSEEKEMYIEEEGLLPSVLNKQIGLSTSDAVVARWYVDDYYEGSEYPINAYVILSLSSLNDDGMPFNQIADIIEYFL